MLQKRNNSSFCRCSALRKQVNVFFYVNLGGTTGNIASRPFVGMRSFFVFSFFIKLGLRLPLVSAILTRYHAECSGGRTLRLQWELRPDAPPESVVFVPKRWFNIYFQKVEVTMRITLEILLG